MNSLIRVLSRQKLSGPNIRKIHRRTFPTQKFFNEKVRVNNNLLRLYRRRLKELSVPLGLKNDPRLKTFVPKFNRSHLSEELMELVEEVPEAEKPMNTVKVLLRGIGYRARWQDGVDRDGNKVTELILRLGFSHESLLTLPEGVEILEGNLKENTFTWVDPNISPSDCQEIVLKSKDLHKVTQFAANIKKLRPPEPYKLKGVFVDTGKKRTRIFKKKGKGK